MLQDVHEISVGVDWQDALNFAVSNCEVFIPLVTPRYGETLWTNREVMLTLLIFTAHCAHLHCSHCLSSLLTELIFWGHSAHFHLLTLLICSVHTAHIHCSL